MVKHYILTTPRTILADFRYIFHNLNGIPSHIGAEPSQYPSSLQYLVVFPTTL